MRGKWRSGSDRRSVSRPVMEPAVRRLVVYDRDVGALGEVTRVLAEEGFAVVAQTSDLERAVRLSRDMRPDVLVMGVAPGADDVAALAQITGHHWAAVVVMVADRTVELVAAVRDAGALGYLSAPPGRGALVAAVEMTSARGAEMTQLAVAVESADRKLRAREDIDRAKTVLMTRYGMSEPEAYRWIQRTAMQRRETSAAVATQITADLGSPGRLAGDSVPADPGRGQSQCNRRTFGEHDGQSVHTR
jgi:AmiR/NasT family two-component response regulator